MEYEKDVGGLVRILNVLRELVVNTATEMRVIGYFEQGGKEHDEQQTYQELLTNFEVIFLLFRIYVNILSAATRH